MSDESASPAAQSALSDAVCQAIAARYAGSCGASYGITAEDFLQIAAAVIVRYAAEASEAERLHVVAALHLDELVLARACSAGCEAAWADFMNRFRGHLYATAIRIAKSEVAGRDLADGLYADLFGINDRSGRRVSKLDYYMGRGSLEGWLRTVLTQRYVDGCRAQSRNVSLEEQIDAGTSFAVSTPPTVAAPSDAACVAALVAKTLLELGAEERFLLASYYLDQRTLADIGRQLRVHESTISRKLERLTGDLRGRLRKKLEASGFNHRRCGELLHELDVRDLDVDIAGNLRQETVIKAFYRRTDP